MTKAPPARRLEYMPLETIVGADVNPKDHADALIGASIGRFGFVETPVVDERTGKLVGGHGRVDDLHRRHAAGESPPDGIESRGGVWFVPVLRGWSSTSDAEAVACGVALNRVGEVGGWKFDVLEPILRDFTLSEVGLDGIGFDTADLDRMVAEFEATKRAGGAGGTSTVRAISVPDTPITVRGDVWVCGEHRIMCGDCRDPADVARLLGNEAASVAFTSPPYAEQRDYDLASGFVPIKPDEYVDWFAPVAQNVRDVLASDGSWFVNIKPKSDGIDTLLYVFDLVLAHVRLWGWHFATEFCWERVGVPGQWTRRFKNQYEPIYQFTRGDWKIRPDAVRFPSDNVPRYSDDPDVTDHASLRLTKGGTTTPHAGSAMEAGLAYPGNRLPTFAGTHDAVGHAAAFPVGLPAWFVRAYTDRDDVVFDPFVGSGSTVLACEQEHRAGRGMDIAPGYIDVAVARWQAATGQLSVRESTGEPVDVLGSMPVPIEEPPAAP